MTIMEQVIDPPDQTPAEREAEEQWIEAQHKRHCPCRIRLAKWVNRWLRESWGVFMSPSVGIILEITSLAILIAMSILIIVRGKL